MLYNTVQAIVPITDTVVIGGNMRRKAIIFGVDGTGTITLNFGRPAIVGGVGFGYQINNQMPPMRFNREDYGEAIKEEVHAVTSSGTTALTITEIFEH